MLTIARCSDGGVPAEITERFRLASTDGQVDHVVVDCAAGHYFRMSAEMLAPQPQPQPQPLTAQRLQLDELSC
jgi:hypothetical protein